MEQGSIQNDSLSIRPLPDWLTSQRDGLNAYQPVKVIMKEDHSLQLSLEITGAFIVFAVTILTFFVLKKNRKQK